MAEGEILLVPLSAGDVDAGDVLSFSTAGLPAFCTFTDNANGSGSISCTPGYEDDGVYAVTVTVNDGGTPSLSDFEVVEVTVTPTNRAPQVGNPGDQGNVEADTVSLQITASDPDGDTLGYSAAGLPAGLAIDTMSGLISGTLTYDSAGSHGVTVSVSDGTAITEVVFIWNVSDVLRLQVASIATGTYVSKGKSYFTANVLVLDDDGTPVSGSDVTAHWAGTGVDTAALTQPTNSGGIAAFVTNGIKNPGQTYTITIDGVVKSGYLYDEQGSVTSGQYPPPAQYTHP